MAIVVNGSTGYGSNTSAPVLSGSNGPWTIGGWFKRNGSQSNRYLCYIGNAGSSVQHAVIFGYVANTVELFGVGYSGTNPRTSSGLTISDDNWHHIAYRKAASGTAAYDKFLDGTKTSINASATTTLGTTARVDIGAAMGGNVATGSFAEWFVIPANISDADISSIAGGNWPSCLGYTSGSFWHLNDNTSPSADTNSNGYNLTLTSGVSGSHPPSVISACATSSAPYHAILQSQPQRRFARS